MIPRIDIRQYARYAKCGLYLRHMLKTQSLKSQSPPIRLHRRTHRPRPPMFILSVHVAEELGISFFRPTIHFLLSLFRE
jgi:hypothetical protein